eukprot:Sspe_Gene.76713::Locus_47934_Transcript_1_1_Confidence_1.000_Length_2746::g.76713::m.76713
MNLQEFHTIVETGGGSVPSIPTAIDSRGVRERMCVGMGLLAAFSLVSVVYAAVGHAGDWIAPAAVLACCLAGGGVLWKKGAALSHLHVSVTVVCVIAFVVRDLMTGGAYDQWVLALVLLQSVPADLLTPCTTFLFVYLVTKTVQESSPFGMYDMVGDYGWLDHVKGEGKGSWWGAAIGITRVLSLATQWWMTRRAHISLTASSKVVARVGDAVHNLLDFESDVDTSVADDPLLPSKLRGEMAKLASYVRFYRSFVPDHLVGVKLDEIQALFQTTAENPLSNSVTGALSDVLSFGDPVRSTSSTPLVPSPTRRVTLSKSGNLSSHTLSPISADLQPSPALRPMRTNDMLTRRQVCTMHVRAILNGALSEEICKEFISVVYDSAKGNGGAVHAFEPTLAVLTFGATTTPLSSPISSAISCGWQLLGNHLLRRKQVQLHLALVYGVCVVGPLGIPRKMAFHVTGSAMDTGRQAVELCSRVGISFVCNEGATSKAKQVAQIRHIDDRQLLGWDGGKLYEVLALHADRLLSTSITASSPALSAIRLSVGTGGVLSQISGHQPLLDHPAETEPLQTLQYVQEVFSNPTSLNGDEGEFTAEKEEAIERLNAQAAECMAVGDSTTADIHLQQALKKAGQAAREAGEVVVVDSLHGLTIVREQQGDWPEALALREELLALERRRHNNQPHVDVAAALNQLGIVCEKLYQLPRAQELHTEALDILKKIPGKEALVIQSQVNLGIVCMKQGSLSRAANCLQSAIDLHRAKLVKGEQDELLAEAQHCLAWVFTRRGDSTRARQSLEESLATGWVVLPDHAVVVSKNIQLAAELRKQGKVAQAQALLQQAEKVEKEELTGWDHVAALTLNNQANLEMAAGRVPEAKQ